MSMRIGTLFKTRKKLPKPQPNLRALAHDLNNLMMTIDGYTGFLKEDLSDKPELAAYADKVLEAARQAERLIRQLDADECDDVNGEDFDIDDAYHSAS